MKSLIIICSFFLPILVNGQFTINYNHTTNIISVVYSGCDLCTYGSIAAVNSCRCWKECENNPTILNDLQICNDLCVEYYGGYEYNYNLLNSCYEGCQTQYYSDVADCADENECGSRPTPKVITQMQYNIWAFWSNIPINPLSDPEGNSHIASGFVSSNNNISIPNWSPGSPWPNIYTGHNTCYYFWIRLYYSDNTECDQQYWICNIIG